MTRRTALFLSMCIAGCPSGDPADGGSEASTLTPDEAAVAYAAHLDARTRASCDREQRCEDNPTHATAEDCVVAEQEAFGVHQDRIVASIADGNSLYDDSAAAACEEAYAGPCDTDTLDILTVCGAVVEGNVAEGGDCIGHFECAEPEGHQGTGPFCFDGCTPAIGDEEPSVAGTCTLTSPVLDEACP